MAPKPLKRNSAGYRRLDGVRDERLVHAVLISVQFVFSGWHVLAKVTLNGGVNPLALALWRECLATTLMLVVARRLDGRVVLQHEHVPRFALLGLASFGNVVGAVVALGMLSPAAFGLMQPSIPVFALIFSWAMGVEAMNRLKVCGVVTAVVGAVIVEATAAASAPETTTGGSSAPILGGCVLLAQCMSMGALAVMLKPVLAIYPAATATAWYYAAGSAITAGACLVGSVQASDLMLTGKWLPWVALAYVTLLATLYTYNALSWATSLVAPTTVTVYSTLQPAGTLILSAIFLGYQVQIAQLLGGAVVVAGLLLSTHAKRREREGDLKTSQDITSALAYPDEFHSDLEDDDTPRSSSAGNGTGRSEAAKLSPLWGRR